MFQLLDHFFFDMTGGVSGSEEEKTHKPLVNENKAVYTTAPVAGGWAGAVMSWARAEMIWAGA